MDTMRDYDDATYGEAFADVYDEWYADIGDLDATTRTLAELAAGGAVLELGVGTGRIAIPLAGEVGAMYGVDTSGAMLERLAAKPGADRVEAVHADMVDGLPEGPFALVFVAYNTFFNLRTAARQQDCFRAVAERLAPGGVFVIEAFVPNPAQTSAPEVGVRSITADRVVLSISTADPHAQTAWGQYVDITETGGVRLRPWSIRWATPVELDEMAVAAGLVFEQRWAGFDRSPFDLNSPRHVSVYRKSETRPLARGAQVVG